MTETVTPLPGPPPPSSQSPPSPISPNPDPVFHSANVQRLEELMAQTQRSIKSLASMLGRAKMREAAILRSVTGGKKPRVTLQS